MLSISELDYISENNIRRFYAAQLAVAMMPDDILDQENRCHELARAIAPLVKGEVRDGKFSSVNHSWIVLEQGRSGPLILDVYAVAQLPQVQLVNCSWHVRDLQNCYVDGPERDDIRNDVVVEMKKVVEALKRSGRLDHMSKLFGKELRTQQLFNIHIVSRTREDSDP